MHSLPAMICALTLVTSQGCHLLGPRRPPPLPMPVVLQPGASLGQVIDAVNNNSRQIHSFSTDRAELSGPGMPVTLRGARIVFERPTRLRIEAGTSFSGPELDVGSNDELFWFWVKRNTPPALFYCRHSEYANCEAARVMPFVEPKWFIEAFGIVEFSPTEQHQGPFSRPDGRLEIVTLRQTPCGPTRKSTIVDAATAVVYEQHLYDYRGQIAVSAIAREHRRDPVTNLILPNVVDLQCPQAQLSMQVKLGNPTINSPEGNSPALWEMPSNAGWPEIDLADPNRPGTFGRQRASGVRPSIPPNGVAPSASALPGQRRSFNRLR